MTASAPNDGAAAVSVSAAKFWIGERAHQRAAVAGARRGRHRAGARRMGVGGEVEQSSAPAVLPVVKFEDQISVGTLVSVSACKRVQLIAHSC